MAEAHQAVAFSFSVTHDGFVINYDAEVLTVVWLSGVRSWKKRIQRFINNFKNGVYPSNLTFLFGILSVVIGLRLFAGRDCSFGFIDLINAHIISPYFYSYLPLSIKPAVCLINACIVWGIILWLAKAMIMRYLLKLLFMYKGWMYEARSRKGPSLQTKIWVVLIKILTTSKPSLYSYQASLPRLPLPDLDGTISRYLRSVRPLCKDDEHFREIEQKAQEFKNGIGRKLQRYLMLKSWWATNYVSDWWEEFVYLRGRQPLMINSNFYGVDMFVDAGTKRQVSRAANLIHAALIFRRKIDRQEMKPILVQGIIPLCSVQYERAFNTTRIPGVETDKLVHYSDASHIVVLYHGKFYKVITHYKGRLLMPAQIEKVLEKIIADESEPSKGEDLLGSLTAADRVTWAKARMDHFTRGINKISLDAIERAAFVVVLEDEEFDFDRNDPSRLTRYCQLLLHGRGNDRWYDKSFNIVVGKNGRAGFNAEHSWADAPIMSHMWEFLMSYDILHLRYNEDGTCRLGNGVEPPNPIRLRWEIDDVLHRILDVTMKSASDLIKDVDLEVVYHPQYGKGFIKKCKVSPDAFIQMALQLAYYRDVGHLSLTYEASMTRLYREGRTETVRPVTIESEEWVKAMHDPSRKKEELVDLLRRACQYHQRGYQDAMCGKGIDRHLFCLYVVSKYLEVDSPFLKEVLSEPWKLSTSQTPMGQADLWDFKKYPESISAGGGFGPVADDGYGVSYIIPGEHCLFFHVSSKRCSAETDSKRMAKNIVQALQDMRSLFE